MAGVRRRAHRVGASRAKAPPGPLLVSEARPGAPSSVDADLLAAGRVPGGGDEQRVQTGQGPRVPEADLAPQTSPAVGDDLVVAHELEHRAGARLRPGAGAVDLLLLALRDDLALDHGRRAPRAAGTPPTAWAGRPDGTGRTGRAGGAGAPGRPRRTGSPGG